MSRSLDALKPYEDRIEPARARMAGSAWVTRMMSPEVDPRELELFLTHFCALGVGMTRPVDGWIRRAGERCIALGYVSIGEAFVKHAKHEAGHHAMMIDDTRSLVARWNAAGRPPLNADALLAIPPTPGIQRYVKVHEDTIAGESPYAQIAIEYEIERMSVVWGPRFVARCVETLGPEIKRSMTFVEDHVTLDVGHTHFNAGQLNGLLTEHPSFLDALVRTGSEALDAYSEFFDDCIRLARAA